MNSLPHLHNALKSAEKTSIPSFAIAEQFPSNFCQQWIFFFPKQHRIASAERIVLSMPKRYFCTSIFYDFLRNKCYKQIPLTILTQ